MPQTILWQLDPATGMKVEVNDKPAGIDVPRPRTRMESFDRGDDLLGAASFPRPPRRPPRVPRMPPAEVVGRDVIAFRPDE